jgi:hypothetical protein
VGLEESEGMTAAVMKLKRCWLKDISPFASEMMAMWPFIESGNMLVAGGIQDQPAPFVQGVGILRKYLSDKANAEIERTRRG